MWSLRGLLFALPWVVLSWHDVSLHAGQDVRWPHAWVLWSWFFWAHLPGVLGPIFRGLLAWVGAALLLTELGVKKHYGAWLDARMLHATLEAWADLKSSLLPMAPMFGLGVLALGIVFYVLLRGMRTSPSPLRTWAFVLGLGFTAARYGEQAPPDARLLHAAFAWRDFGTRALTGANDLPEIPAPPASHRAGRLPHVLLVITESIRASDACTVHGAPCETQREIDAEMPDRMGFGRGYSLASYTLVSVATMLEGHMPTGATRPPQLFDYLMQVRGNAIAVAYFGTHAAEVLSRPANSARIPSFASLENFHTGSIDDEDLLLSEANDAKLVPLVRDYAVAHKGKPSFTVVHFSGTHAPYYVNESVTPFTPWTHSANWSTLVPLHNAYKNAIAMQSRTTAELLHAFKAAHADEPWVVIYTSDHGEAFGEHSAIHHGQNTYDEQTHVPFWLAYGNDALRGEQEANVISYGQRVVTHADVTPTILDLYGLLDALPWAPQRAKFQGRSWLRTPRTLGLLPITSCTPLFTCPLANWGVMSQDKKLLAQPWDATWRCVSIPDNTEMPPAACEALRTESRVLYPQLPNGKPNAP